MKIVQIQKLWAYIKSKKHEQVGISDLKVNDKMFQDPKDKANILNKQFSSVFSNLESKIEYMIKQILSTPP